MVHKYLSDREKGAVERSSEEINIAVWNGIVSVYENLIANNALSSSYPDQCPDGQGISGCDRSALENALKSEIPNLCIPVRAYLNASSFQDAETPPDSYAILDFIEFLYKSVRDPHTVGRYHDFYRHYHYIFSNDGVAVEEYREKINTIFERNGIIFYLDNDGLIKRSVTESLKKIVSDVRFNTKDERLNELLAISYSKFILPKIDSRIESLEKIWDAFERIKTYYEGRKNISAGTLITAISDNNDLFKTHIDNEFAELTRMGNAFQIRHFERDKVQLHSNLHIDYLFYRMSSLIHLCVESIKNG